MPQSRADLAIPDRMPRTFDEAFAELHLTPAERTALAWHLAAYRARKTVEALLPETNAEEMLGFNPRDILRAAGQSASKEE